MPNISISKGPVQAGNMAIMAGTKSQGLLYITADVADEETVTIGADTYEFDRAADGVVAGNIAVVGHADDTAANATNALITTINASGTMPVTAVDGGDNEVHVKHNLAGAFPLALTETLDGAGNIWSAATMTGGAGPALKKQALTSRVPTANEVTTGNLRVALDFTPTFATVTVLVTSTLLQKAWDGRIDIDPTNNIVTLDNNGTTDWAATDTCAILIMG